MAGKLKGINIKGFFVKHGEKLVFGLVAAFAAYVLFGTNWVPFQHHPLEITNAVEEAKDKLHQKSWPQEEQTQFVVSADESVGALVSNIRTHVDPSPYLLSENFEFDLYGTTAPITEPEFMPVQALRADAGHLVMFVIPEEEEPDLLEDPAVTSTDEKAPMDDEADIPDQFKSRDTFSQVPGSSARRGSSGGKRKGKGEDDDNFGGALSLGRGGLRFGGGDDDDDDYDSTEQGGRARSAASTGEGRGQRYVAVRGVVPLHEQINKIKKASNVGRATAEMLYELMNFELQRMKMLPEADDPWSGDWEPVDIEVSKEVLRDAAGFDAEVVEGIVTDSVITMPLPELVMGRWGQNATHPDLENFTLTDDEIDLEMKIYEQLLKRHQEEIADAPEEPIEKGGFADLMGANSRRLAGTVGRGGNGLRVAEDDGPQGGFGRAPTGSGRLQSGARIAEDEDDGPSGFGGRGLNFAAASRGYTQTVSADDFLNEFKDIQDEELKTKLKAYVEDKITASGQLLLFRYLDFDVEPGATYKYRVRLEVANPNYGRKSSEAAGIAEVVEGQTRKTEWSNITDLVHVPRDAEYFVTKVDQPRGGTSLATSNFAIYKWDPEYGTTVAVNNLDVELGQEVGGPVKTHVLDPAQYTFEVEDYLFQTGDVLVDAVGDETIQTRQHPDLQIATGRDLELSNQAIVLQGDGRLVVIDEVTGRGDLEQRKKLLGFEQRLYEDIKDASVKEDQYANAGGGIFGEDYDDVKGGSGGKGKDDGGRGRSRRRNPLGKGKGRNVRIADDGL
ncbi:MAG: hypothetical protein R3B91_02810 [Planctomycetaceae bacterium]